RSDVLTNSLVLVGAPGRSVRWSPPQSLAQVVGEGRVALADPEAVPAGRYAREAIERLGEWEGMRGQVVPTENVRAALALVERGEAPLGVVYATDQMASRNVELVGVFPAAVTPSITYPAALLATSEHAQA